MLLLTCFLSCLAVAADDPPKVRERPVPPRIDQPFLKQNDRVAFLGDSITARGLYTKHIESWIRAFHPELQIRFINAGKGSDTASGGLRRLDEDVLQHEPTVVVICFGMNDAIVQERGGDLDPAQVELYVTSHRQIIERLRERGIRILLLTPPCTNSRVRPDLEGHNRRLLALSAALKELAVTENVPILDLFHPLLKREAEYSRHDPSGTLIPDGVHPDAAGGLVIAMEILQTWGLAPCLKERVSDREQLQDNRGK